MNEHHLVQIFNYLDRIRANSSALHTVESLQCILFNPNTGECSLSTYFQGIDSIKERLLQLNANDADFVRDAKYVINDLNDTLFKLQNLLFNLSGQDVSAELRAWLVGASTESCELQKPVSQFLLGLEDTTPEQQSTLLDKARHDCQQLLSPETISARRQGRPLDSAVARKRHRKGGSPN